MSLTDKSSLRAWEPLTPRGVAVFARSPLKRLLLAQAVVAILVGIGVVWFLHEQWFPVVRSAIRQLPTQGEIRKEQLEWTGESPIKLAGNHCLAFAVDLTHSGQLGRDAQIQFEFGRKNLRIFSPVDYAVVNYPEGWRIALNRPELESLWGAWELPLLVGAGIAVFLGVLAFWALLATVYWVPVWLIAFFGNRDLSWLQSWRLAGAALISGELFLTAVFIGHGLGWVTLVQLAGATGLDLVAGWVYLVICPFFLPRHPFAAKQNRNPFARPPEKGNAA